jgi:spore coat protein A
MDLSRRDVMKMGVLGSAAMMLPAERFARTELQLANRLAPSEMPDPFTVPFAVPPVLAPEFRTANHDYYRIKQVETKAEILPGKLTTIWGYNGITPGPTIMNQQGRAAVVQMSNDLPAVHPDLRYEVWTSTHLHGSCSKPQYDGYASDITPVDHWKDYVYPNVQDARTLWYHDHGVHITAPNAYMGLAAAYILHDPVEQALPIPHGAYDVPLILRDAMFESSGDLIYDDNSQSGVYGDVILVNGKPWPAMPVERRKYRFRVLNAAISRSFDLRLSTGEPMTVIGTDGGLMPHPQECPNVRVSMAERYEIVIDFSKYKIGERIVLQNVSPKNNIDYDTTHQIMAFDVVGDATDLSNNEIPADLNPNQNVMGLQESQSVATRQIDFERSGGEWTINGTTWADVVNSNYEFTLANPQLNDVEVWELTNKSGGWFHPVHIHLVDFKVLDRNGQPPHDYEKGPKDVVYVGENETVRVLMRFEHQEGRYMIHCHNLVHEDHDMMAQFQVGGNKVDNDPLESDPCKEFPLRPLRDRKDDPDEDEDRGGGGGGGGGGHGGDRDRSAVSAAPAPPAAIFTASSIKAQKKVKKAAKKRVSCRPVVKTKTRSKARPKSKARSRAAAKRTTTKRTTQTTCAPVRKKAVKKRSAVKRRGR